VLFDDIESTNGVTFGSKDVLAETGISLRQLYYWELKGIIDPIVVRRKSREFKRYTQEHINRLKTVKELVDQGWTLTAAIAKTAWMKK